MSENIYISLANNSIPVRGRGLVVNVAALWDGEGGTRNVAGIIPPGVDTRASYREHLDEKYL